MQFERRFQKTSVYLPFHLDGGNRGCEGISRGIAKILNLSCDMYNMLSRDIELDDLLGIGAIGKLTSTCRTIFDFPFPFGFVFKALRKLGMKCEDSLIIQIKDFLKNADSHAPIVFTGGDLYCYQGTSMRNTLLMEHLEHLENPTILWGCSVIPDFLDARTLRQLHRFSKIVCRESLSAEVLDSFDIRKQVSVHPDPAFVLKSHKTLLPPCFADGRKIVGINVSNYVGVDRKNTSPFEQAITDLIKLILTDNANYVLLIPHVTWDGQDDRIACNKLYQKFIETKRIEVLQIANLSYVQIRYIISQCEMFVGSRTHSVISAYSTATPAIAIGYSIKSKGIAKDLGLDERLVVDSKSKNVRDKLFESYEYLTRNRKSIKQHLKTMMPEYINKAYAARKEIEEYL